VLLFTDHLVLHDDATDTGTPRNFQIAHAFREECQKRSVMPYNAGVDVSGSPAFGDIVAREWSPEVYRMQFGGKASEKKVGEDKKLAHEKYANRATEVWFVARDYMQAGQIKGVSPDLAIELTTRRYTAGAVVEIEPKRKLKSRTGKSCDIADSALTVVELCRSRHGFKVSLKAAVPPKRACKNQYEGLDPDENPFQKRKRAPKTLIHSRSARNFPRVSLGMGRNLSLVR
jgi:hypothetical protein